jgi:hypothetical protein
MKTSKWADPRACSATDIPSEFKSSEDFKTSIPARIYNTIMDNTKKFTTKQKWRNMGRLRKVRVYDFNTRNNQFNLSHKTYDFSKQDLSKVIKEVNSSNYKSKGFPLPINDVCRFVGVYKGAYPSRRHRIPYQYRYRPDYNALKTLPVNDMDNINPLTQVFPGDWKYCCENLEIMASSKPVKYSIDDLIAGYESRYDIDFKMPYIKNFSKDIINGLLIKPNAFPGLLTFGLFKKVRKVTTQLTKTFAKYYFDYICKSPCQVVDMSYFGIGGREKRLEPKESYKKVRTRLILMAEDIPILIGQCVAVPLTKAFQRLNDGFCWIGRSLEEQNFLKVYEDVNGNCKDTITFNADFSAHDNYVDEGQIVVAMSYLRLCFPKQWNFMNKIFYYCLSSLVFKHIVLPGSKMVFRLSKGLPSGHAFTSLINTMCAYGVFATAFHKAYLNDPRLKDTRIYAMGDDVIGRIHIDKVREVDYYLTQSGMKLDPIQLTCGPMNSNINEYNRTFLKKVITPYGVKWNRHELLENICFPTSPYRKSSSHIINRYIDLMMEGPYIYELNPYVLELIRLYCRYPLHRGLFIDPLLYSDYVTPTRSTMLSEHKRNIENGVYYNAYYKNFIRKYNIRQRIASRWFWENHVFPIIGKKDESYWVDATKNLTKPLSYPREDLTEVVLMAL